MSISKSVRFEIFTRDAFTCQYCGKRPPDAVLELDHIHPRSKGGDDDPLNLVTSCWECNRGKSAKVLGEIPKRPDADLLFLKAQQEIAEARRYLETKVQRDAILTELCANFEQWWADELDDGVIPPRSTFSTWIHKYGPEELEVALRIFSLHVDRFRYGAPSTRVAKMGKYVSGILRSRASSDEGTIQ